MYFDDEAVNQIGSGNVNLVTRQSQPLPSPHTSATNNHETQDQENDKAAHQLDPKAASKSLEQVVENEHVKQSKILLTWPSFMAAARY